MQRFRWLHLVLAAGVALTFFGRSPAQQFINKDQDEQFNKIRFQFVSKVLTGQEPANTAQLELASRYYVSRVTYPNAQTDTKVMAAIVRDFEEMTHVVVTSAKTNRDIVGKFAPHLVNRFNEVFGLDFADKRMALVNAALMLPQAARFKQEPIGDLLAKLIDDEKQHDVVRVYAAKGLREFFPTKPFTKFETADKQTLEKKTRDTQRVNALMKFIDRPMPATTDPYEIAALRYLRREAVEVLALSQVPAVSALDKGGKIEGPVALGLIKVLAKKVQPEPSTQERIEAAIGICQFTQYVDEYDPKIGIYLVGTSLIDLIGDYKKDQPNIANKSKDKKPTLIAWRLQTKRLDNALADLANNFRNTPSGAAAQTLEAAGRPILKAMYNADGIDNEQPFRTLVGKLRPNTKTLFKDNKGAPLLEYDWQPAVEEEKN